MHWLDYVLVFIPLLVVLWIGIKTQRYLTGVSDFLTAGRVAGRYVISVASGEAGLGLISLVALFEMYYTCGFGISFWSKISAPLGLIFALTGFCTYRYRETRAMTMGQFFEMRYNRTFRIFAAILQSISGVINYAIFPAVGARCLIYFLDLPAYITIFGMGFPTFGLAMFFFLSIAVWIVMMGGQITIMVTDCVQGLLSYPMYVVIVGFILYKFSWTNEMAPTLLDTEPGKSFLNPYDVYNLRNFNLFYVMVGIFSSIFNRMAWSGTSGYNAAAATPHEQKIGGLLGTWRSGLSVMMYTLMAIAAFTYMKHINYQPQATKVSKQLTLKTISDIASEDKFNVVRGEISDFIKSGKAAPELQQRVGDKFDLSKPLTGTEDYKEVAKIAIDSVDKAKGLTFNTIYSQMLVPIAVRDMLPIGITGIMCAIMIFLMVSTDTTYMHSWGSIIVQDVVLPFCPNGLRPEVQLKLLRFVIAGVAAFAFLFSLLFAQVDFILMFFAITGAIWLGGAGPVIVFGLYWRRGTAAGAFTSLISGSSIAVGGIVCQQMWVKSIYPFLSNNGLAEPVKEFLWNVSSPFHPLVIWDMTPDKFPINSQEIYFIAMLVSISLYIVISLLTCREKFNMDRMLHRGIYHTEGIALQKTRFNLSKIVGITSQYTTGDKILAWSVFIWSFVYNCVICFALVIIWNLFHSWPNEWWAWYFYINSILLAGVVGLVTTIWFSIGGTKDLIQLFQRLEGRTADTLDDGRVAGHISLADIKLVEKVEHQEMPKK
ncbi:MAG: hypothetical protein PHI56_04570 [Victivallaceae bacterium]|nr:hypothetical protein [Victivallaceae bacterium]